MGMMGALSAQKGSSSTSTNSTTKTLTDEERKQLASVVQEQQKYAGENIEAQQEAIRNLAASYDPATYEQRITDESLRQLADTQAQLQSEGAAAAGSAYNTASQAAFQRAYSDAAIKANAQAAQDVAAQNLAQYEAQAGLASGANTDLMNLYETLMGAWSQSQGTSRTKSKAVGAAIGI